MAIRHLLSLGLTAAVLLVGAGARADSPREVVSFEDPLTGEWFVPGPDGIVEHFYFGNPGDRAMMGDWDCDGVATPGQFRSSDGYAYLSNRNSQSVAAVRYYLGNPGDVPLAGDFDGDGCDTVSLYRPGESRAFIFNRLGSGDEGLGWADSTYLFGNPGDTPFVGDFDGDGIDTVGLSRPGSGFIYLRNSHRSGPAQAGFFFGNPGDRLVAGDWDGDGADTPMALRPESRTMYTRSSNAPGIADRVCLGGERWWVPVAGSVPEEAAPGGAVTLALDPGERAALGPRTSLLATWDGGRAVLDDCRPSVATPIVIPKLVTFSYLDGHGAPSGVTWAQWVTQEGTVLVRQPWREARSPAPGGIVLAWQANGCTSRYIAQLDAAPGLTVTSPVWWFVSADGSIAGDGDQALVRAAHTRGIAIWPAVAGLDPDANHLALQDPAGLAAVVADRARALGVDGVNVDLEGYRDEDGGAVVDFVAALTERVHAWGGVVSVDLTTLTDLWEITSVHTGDLFWSTAPQRRRLAEAADYLVLMAYDEYNRHRTAGPVASPHWVEDATRFLLRYADPGRVILGMPFYGRLWSPTTDPRSVAIGAVAAMGGAGRFDERFGLDRVGLPDGRYFWVETPAGLAHRVELASELGLAGMAAWRLGFDSAAVWRVVAPG